MPDMLHQIHTIHLLEQQIKRAIKQKQARSHLIAQREYTIRLVLERVQQLAHKENERPDQILPRQYDYTHSYVGFDPARSGAQQATAYASNTAGQSYVDYGPDHKSVYTDEEAHYHGQRLKLVRRHTLWHRILRSIGLR